jgi:MraZ protein
VDGNNAVFVGTYEHSLDEKGRLILPSSFREAFGQGAYLSKQVDGCLALMTVSVFEEQARDRVRLAKAGRDARNVARAFAAGTASVAPDKQGRIAIPAGLRSYAALVRDVVVIGSLNLVEIWDSRHWAEAGLEGDEALAAGDDLDLSLRLLLGGDQGS